jgi:hypothetical protein
MLPDITAQEKRKKRKPTHKKTLSENLWQRFSLTH